MRIEIIPTPGIVDRVAVTFPAHTDITVTCLPQHGITPTVQTAIELAGRDFTAVPHLAARQVGSEAVLHDSLDAFAEAGIRTLFIVGGDGRGTGGPYADGGELLEAVRAHSGAFYELGVAGYPEGHPHFDVAEGIDLLRRKQVLADFAVTQMCFTPDTLVAYLGALRAEGVALPIWLGVPGRVRLHRLLAVAARIGVGASLSFARKGSTRQLLRGGHFDSDAFIARVEAETDQPERFFSGLHFYSFNDLDSVKLR
ncbi:methylenetetrahydrofolate reductase [Klugiella xanthotipulae]|uniref:methylenetetrahydrofolate reductase n=1 Tax=Klugiella xanthotipulae TaxID=244735 RepID=UPI0014768C09|nr:methylenetetrahydrofolate reductase [Klugiella xanthotipulae]